MVQFPASEWTQVLQYTLFLMAERIKHAFRQKRLIHENIKDKERMMIVK